MTGGIQIKRFNWLRMQSSWEQHEAWRDKRRVMMQDFQALNDLAVNAFATAHTNLTEGLARLAAESAAARLRSEFGARLNRLV
jgi:hypothetical protein